MVQVHPKDTIVKLSSGGGGIGRPEERDPEMVRKDVRNGIVSIKAAREVYKVAINSKTFAIDPEQTRALRESV
jgi:N-methylhydantoinase B